MHRGTGCETVIYEDYGTILNVWLWSVAAIDALAPCQFLLLPSGDSVNHVIRNAKPPHYLIVEHAHTTRCYRTHREFFVPGDAQFAHEEDIQRSAERAGYFIGDRYSTAGQCENDHTRAIRIGTQLRSQ
jgi:hypothetical protein